MRRDGLRGEGPLVRGREDPLGSLRRRRRSGERSVTGLQRSPLRCERPSERGDLCPQRLHLGSQRLAVVLLAVVRAGNGR